MSFKKYHLKNDEKWSCITGLSCGKEAYLWNLQFFWKNMLKKNSSSEKVAAIEGSVFCKSGGSSKK